MKHAWWMSVIMALAAILPARAQDEATYAVGVAASYAVPDDLRHGGGAGVSFTRMLSPLFSVEFGVEHYRFDHPDSNNADSGTIRVTPYVVAAQVRPQFGWNPYLGVGVGYYVMSYDQTGAAATACNCEFTVDNTVVGHFMVGFDVPLRNRLTATLDARFASGRADTVSRNLTTAASVSDDVTLNYRKFAVGLKYWF